MTMCQQLRSTAPAVRLREVPTEAIDAEVDFPAAFYLAEMHQDAPLCITAVKTQKTKAATEETSEVTRLSVTLPSDLYREVELLAKRDSRSLAWVIRRAVENLVKQEQPLFHQS
jgi:hypothetical protein